MTGHDSPDRAFKDFLDEAEEIVDRLGSKLADLVDMADGGEVDPDLLNSIFREAHSLKGLAGMFGLDGILDLSHALESLLDRIRLGKLDLDKPEIALLLESHQLIEALVRDLAAGGVASHGEEIAGCIARINAALDSSGAPPNGATDRLAGLPERLLGSLTEFEEHRLRENLRGNRQVHVVQASFELASFDRDLERLTDALKSHGEVISTLPGIGERGETHIDFEILYGTFLGREAVEALVGAENIAVNPAGTAPPSGALRSGPDGPSDADSPYGAPGRGGWPGEAKRLSRSVRVDIGKLDELLDTVADLALTHAAISGIVRELRKQGIDRPAGELFNASRKLERRLSELRKGILDIRMVPVGRFYEKMSRIVRGISREQGKLADLTFIGGDTELDKLIAEDVSDPLMHIIRNAIDHGIEPPERRAGLGKDRRGTITVAARQQGSHVVIEIADDGGGIDLERVRSVARRKGLIAGPDPSDGETLDLLFSPGFSTTTTVSDISGRGVGLDVVKSNITAISGQIAVETWPGAGTRLTLTVPITLAVIKALIVSCAGRTYALPTASVHEALLLNSREIGGDGRGVVIDVRETTMPLLFLDSFLGIGGGGERPEECYAIIAGIGERRMGLVVDDLLGEQDIVVKPLGPAFKGVEGISGAADLGGQRTILVLDTSAIVAETLKGGS